MRTSLIIPAMVLLLGLGAAVAQGQGADDLLRQGQEIFGDNCAACHRSNGEGLPNTFPALNKNPWVVGDPKPVIATILNGRKGHLGLMPSWKDKLSDQEVAAVVTYIRHAWSNRAPAVTPATVAGLRGK